MTISDSGVVKRNVKKVARKSKITVHNIELDLNGFGTTPSLRSGEKSGGVGG